MDNYKVGETFKTPTIDGSISNGTLIMKGRSLPEDAKAFYLPFREWLNRFYESTAEEIKVTIQLEYYNTATSKLLINLLLKLEKLQEKKPVTVEWIYDEDDLEMEETGNDFKNLIGDMITMKAIKS